MASNDAHRASINSFAIRSFRDVADCDYIAARLSFKHNLWSQFFWQSLQAIEKYIKGVLLLNRIPARDLGHDLEKALKRCEQLPFDFNFTDGTKKFITQIDQFGRWRYLEFSYVGTGHMLIELDRTVWELRRFCQPLDYAIKTPNGEQKQMLKVNLERIVRSQTQPYQKFHLTGGLLEQIVKKRDHPSRGALIWRNGFFGSGSRRRIQYAGSFHATNAPLWLNPDLIEDLTELIYLPKEVINAYRDEITLRLKNKLNK